MYRADERKSLRERSTRITIFGHRELDLAATVCCLSGWRRGPFRRLTREVSIVSRPVKLSSTSKRQSRNSWKIVLTLERPLLVILTARFAHSCDLRVLIEIRIKENGLGTIEVVDNGKGIPREDYDFVGESSYCIHKDPSNYGPVALKYHTSKLTSFEDLAGIETFGFRGEALSSLCALCESVTVTTATSEDAPMATVLEFDRMGRVVSHAGKAARSVRPQRLRSPRLMKPPAWDYSDVTWPFLPTSSSSERV